MKVFFLILGIISLLVYIVTSEHSIAKTEVKNYAFEGSERPIIIELYTSQGCSSCPPADNFLGELANHDNVIPLSFHIDYWNYIGWKDPYSNSKYTYRQRQYNNKMQRKNIYTPQMIIDGYLQTSGNRRNTVYRFIQQAFQQQEAVDVMIEQTDSNTFKIKVANQKLPSSDRFDIWLIGYDDTATTEVTRGENRGRTLTNSNIVRHLAHLGQWSGERKIVDHSVDWDHQPDNLVVLVQEERLGKIVGAAQIEYQR